MNAKYDTIRLRATGNAIGRLLEVACEVDKCLCNSIKVDVKTATVLAQDTNKNDGKVELEERCISAVYVRISRFVK